MAVTLKGEQNSAYGRLLRHSGPAVPGWPGAAGSVVTEPLLSRGDTLGVVAPGFGVRRTALEAGLRRLRSLGYRVLLGDHVYARNGYLAGSDEERARDLNGMLENPDVRAVWFARGGYGSARLLDRVRWRALARSSKTLIGYSDVTALFAAALRQGVGVCLYGPVVTELGEPKAFHLPSLRRVLRGEPLTLKISRRQVLQPGKAAGRLLGGNLTVLVHLLGTRYAPDLRGAILFIEDAGESAYRLDRLLQHLSMSGSLKDVTGVLVGSFDSVGRHSFLRDRPILDLLRETFLPLGVPVVMGLKAGHLPGKRTLPIGGLARLDTMAGKLEVKVRPR